MTASLNSWIDRIATTFVMVTMLAALPPALTPHCQLTCAASACAPSAPPAAPDSPRPRPAAPALPHPPPAAPARPRPAAAAATWSLERSIAAQQRLLEGPIPAVEAHYGLHARTVSPCGVTAGPLLLLLKA